MVLWIRVRAVVPAPRALVDDRYVSDGFRIGGPLHERSADPTPMSSDAQLFVDRTNGHGNAEVGARASSRSVRGRVEHHVRRRLRRDEVGVIAQARGTWFSNVRRHKQWLFRVIGKAKASVRADVERALDGDDPFVQA